MSFPHPTDFSRLNNRRIEIAIKPLCVFLLLVLLQACAETSSSQVGISDKLDDKVVDLILCDSNASITDFTPVTAVVATTAADFSSGAHALINGDSTAQFTSLNNLDATASDITIVAFGDYFYRIGRQYAGNSITKYAFDNPQQVIWQYSVNEIGAAVDSNPYDMIFVSETKAYVLRYNKTKAWIVNPSATNEADFKIGELDLSAYGAGDGIPEMATGLIADGRLYIVLQRLEGSLQKVENDAYIAVFDVTSDLEIDANISGDIFKGIRLGVRNPNSIVFLASEKILYVQASGSFFPMQYVGGIETISLSDYSSKLLLDDGDDASHPYGLITSLAVLSPELLYFVGYQGYTMNTLYAMDIAKHTVTPVTVVQLIDGQIQSLAVDPQGLLWVSDNANATVRILNPFSCQQIDAVSTNLNPAKIVFKQEQM